MTKTNPITEIFLSQSWISHSRIRASLSYKQLSHNFISFTSIGIHTRIVCISRNMQILCYSSGKCVSGQFRVIIFLIIIAHNVVVSVVLNYKIQEICLVCVNVNKKSTIVNIIPRDLFFVVFTPFWVFVRPGTSVCFQSPRVSHLNKSLFDDACIFIFKLI